MNKSQHIRKGAGMTEIRDEAISELINRYDRCVIEYSFLSDEMPYRGIDSHRDALEHAMILTAQRNDEKAAKVGELFGEELAQTLKPWIYDTYSAEATKIDPEQFLFVPDVRRTDINGTVFYDTDCDPENDGFEGTIPYWYAFLEPPHGSGYAPDDLRKINSMLFPDGPDGLEIYEWTTDWSDYFDDGHEWWGAACWSIYDAHRERYTVMLASATD